MSLADEPKMQKLITNQPPELRDRLTHALNILGAGLAAVDPYQAIKNALVRQGDQLSIAGRKYNLADYERVLVVGAGKAGAPMGQAVADILGDKLTAGAINVKYHHSEGLSSDKIKLSEAGHPVLDEAGLQGTRAILNLLAGTTERDLVIAVISGGGSALLELPVEGVTLAEMQTLANLLLKAGATINQINTVRKHLSQVKGGNLARLAAPANVISLILSDVVGSPLDVIASGPTVPDTSTFAEAGQVLTHFDLWGAVPPKIGGYLKRGEGGQIRDTPKNGDPIFERVQNVVVADNRVAALAAVEAAQSLGYTPLLLTTFAQGEARELAGTIINIGREVLAFDSPIAKPAALLMGGETTVTVKGDGLGGRNQEMALAAAIALADIPNVLFVPLATDGTDGPNDAAGAVASAATLAKAARHSLNPRDYLNRNDSYHFFEAIGDLLITGPTRTNVNDLAVLLVW